jgi:hypothetical protein
MEDKNRLKGWGMGCLKTVLIVLGVILAAVLGIIVVILFVIGSCMGLSH